MSENIPNGAIGDQGIMRAMTAQASSSAAWTWLLGTTAAGSRGATAAPAFPPGGAFRHAPFRASDPGQGQDPALEPRV